MEVKRYSLGKLINCQVSVKRSAAVAFVLLEHYPVPYCYLFGFCAVTFVTII